MNIVADENLAFTDYFFADLADIQHHAGRTLTQQDLIKTQALLVRSVTQVNAALLHGTPVEFVASATIGTDHLDISYLEQQGVTWANAAGCNAQAVAEYVITALLKLKPELIDAVDNFCLGIVGLGNVGTRLAAMAKLLGWKVLGCDPLVQHEQIEQVDLSTLLQHANAVSLHVPMVKTGQHATYHLINAERLAQLSPETILINSSRGAVIAERDLMTDIRQTQRKVVLDVFEHEPMISKELLDLVTLVTPHIAGYSLEGKARGTQMIYEAFCKKYQLAINKDFRSQLPACEPFFQRQDLKQALVKHLSEIYDIQQDDANLRACVVDGWVHQPAFDALRKNYPLRREWAAHGGPQA
ncbi:4-phosphoerythronate dehydrogenase [Acinetobacter sp. ANC 4635]|uniref:4-phosphoerythronate dehydrogenase n=1 Tax=Acinetobacter sp. ANC 4635 TaxID=2529846 RepID=UPI00103C7B92|nr:4-phosphoerythronate dehydrogenase [Acinetobacter sp. ANC 4635]TCB32232.1 4-phosphoerythronate dehydrogenase [Acinetobacter sp. ANC 4635]